MGSILRRRLPERLAGKFPPLLVELGVGIMAALVTVGARLPLDPVLHERAPYVFIFLGIVVASLLAGWRSGLVALVAGQTLTWFAIVEPRWSFAIADDARFGGLIVGTVSEALILWVVALYQREIDAASAEREQRMNLLRQALSEIDHRTKNNYQTVLSLVRLQARRAQSPEAKEALQIASERIEAVALVSQQLAHRSEGLDVVRFGDHLRALCSQVERGLSRDGVQVECEAEEIVAKADKAIALSIIVNELVTNALKHAFRERNRGRIEVKSHANANGLELVVRDDGAGFKTAPRAPAASARKDGGLVLVEAFVRQLGGTHEVSSGESGTTHRILVPSVA